MSQTVIPTAFEQYLQTCQLNRQPVDMDEIVLAHIPGLDEDAQVDRDNLTLSTGSIVYRAAPEQKKAINHNAVAYALVMDTSVGDFVFNAMYLVNRETGTIGMAVFKGLEEKLATASGQTGNSLVKTLIMQYQGAAGATHIGVDASSWTVDYHDRLVGLHEDDRLSNVALMGSAAFLEQAFYADENVSDGRVDLSPGVAYVNGLRCEIKSHLQHDLSSVKPWVVLDACQTGRLTGRWETQHEVRNVSSFVREYVDEQGVTHYVAPVGRFRASESIFEDHREAVALPRHQHDDYLKISDAGSIFNWRYQAADITTGVLAYDAMIEIDLPDPGDIVAVAVKASFTQALPPESLREYIRLHANDDTGVTVLRNVTVGVCAGVQTLLVPSSTASLVVRHLVFANTGGTGATLKVVGIYRA